MLQTIQDTNTINPVTIKATDDPQENINKMLLLLNEGQRRDVAIYTKGLYAGIQIREGR